jgi:hypothetical protein
MRTRIATPALALALALGLGAAAACGDDNSASSPPTTTAPPTATETEPPTTQPKPKPKPKPTVKTTRIVVKGGRPQGGIQRPVVKKGDRVRIVIRTDAGVEVHLHGYDITRPVKPGQPTVLAFRATIPGRFELELHHPDSLLADLQVRP